jgi:hypothetical protein
MYLFLQLGSHPPANQFVAPEGLNAPEPSFPLDCHVCLDCALIQVPNYITSDFFRHYVYVPSGATTMRDHFAELARVLTSRYVQSPDDLVVDIGSNEGLFLGFCSELGTRNLGVEPAANLTAIARGRGLDVVNEYFTPDTAREVRAKYGPARVIVTTNTFNHIDALHDFMDGITILLADEGAFVIEVPHSLDLVRKNEFDTIYHEHVSEFSVKSLVDLFRMFHLEIHDIERLEIHGGSMRVHGQRVGAGRPVSPVVEQWLAREREAELFSEKTYDAFRERVEANKEKLLRLLSSLKQEGKRLAGYGAPAKGNTLLNYYGIGTDYLEFLGDRNPLKQGLYSPGMHIPVVPPETILREQPDYVLILAWNFSDEIMQQQAEYRRRGGKFILPVPEPVIVP